MTFRYIFVSCSPWFCDLSMLWPEVFHFLSLASVATCRQSTSRKMSIRIFCIFCWHGIWNVTRYIQRSLLCWAICQNTCALRSNATVFGAGRGFSNPSSFQVWIGVFVCLCGLWRICGPADRPVSRPFLCEFMGRYKGKRFSKMPLTSSDTHSIQWFMVMMTTRMMQATKTYENSCFCHVTARNVLVDYHVGAAVNVASCALYFQNTCLGLVPRVGAMALRKPEAFADVSPHLASKHGGAVKIGENLSKSYSWLLWKGHLYWNCSSAHVPLGKRNDTAWTMTLAAHWAMSRHPVLWRWEWFEESQRIAGLWYLDGALFCRSETWTKKTVG